MTLWLCRLGVGGQLPTYLPLWSGQPGHITDLVLIYQGGTHRPQWNQEQFAPYVTWKKPDASAKEEWLFDGFLFVEFKDGKGRDYTPGYGGKPSRRTEWHWLLDRNFGQATGLGALNAAVGDAARRLGTPRTRRKVVLTLPEPVPGQKDWGTVDGRPLDFSSDEDRVAACRWHVQQARALWSRANFEHLELAGFYWVAEHSAHAKTILPAVSEFLRQTGYRLYWIPYWNSKGAAEWKELGFDFAWQQPNHFFHPGKVPDSRLADATRFARSNHLGMEFEADFRAITNPEDFRPRFYKYLEAFERDGAKYGASIAYYEGGGALGKMAGSSDPEVRAMYDTLCRWVVDRQSRVAAPPGPRHD